VTEWVAGQRLVLEPNPYYFGRDSGRPFFEKIIVRFVGQDANTALAMLMAGECDVVSQTVGLEEQWDLLLELRDKERVQVHATPGTALEHLGFVLHPVDHDDGYDYGDPPGLFVDARTRQALAMGLGSMRPYLRLRQLWPSA
jgi:ABC-type transport system substrate-binding protein